ncbi:hypothetical protein D3C86_1347490 [compost metagenome]
MIFVQNEIELSEPTRVIRNRTRLCTGRHVEIGEGYTAARIRFAHVVVTKEEDVVSPDRTAGPDRQILAFSCGEAVEDLTAGAAVARGRIGHTALAPQRVRRIEGAHAAVELIRARTRDNADHAAGATTVLGLIAARLDVNGLDRVERQLSIAQKGPRVGNVHTVDVVRALSSRGAREARQRLPAARAGVDRGVRSRGARRQLGDRVDAATNRHPVGKILDVHRQARVGGVEVLHLLGGDDHVSDRRGAVRGAAGLQQGKGVARRTRLHDQTLIQRIEARLLNGDVIRANRQSRDAESTGSIRADGPHRPLSRRNAHGGARDGRAAAVRHGARKNPAGVVLR